MTEKLENIEVIVTDEDLSNVDTDKLTSVLSQSAYLMLAALVKQSVTETSRIDKLNALISKTEDDLFSDEVFVNLRNEEKIKLYDTIIKNKNSSLSFMNKVHENASKGMEAVAVLENQMLSSEKSVRRILTGEDKTKNKEMKLYIQKLVEEKLEEKKLLGMDK